MDASHPLLDVAIWLRFLFGLILIVGLPGYVLVGRHLASGDRVGRLLHGTASGLLLVPILGIVLSALGPSLRAPIYLPVALGLGLGLGRWRRWRETWHGLLPSRERPSLVARLGLLASVLSLAWIVIPSWGELTAPLGDAANHAFLTLRVAETGSLLPRDVFAEPYSAPGFTYFAGWHAAAAMIAQVSGVAPWVVSWLLPVSLIVLSPLVFWLLWRDCGVGPRVGALAAVLMGFFHFYPVGVFAWSGNGIFVGWFLVPFLVAAVVQVHRAGTMMTGLVVGLLLLALVTVHASELFLVTLFAMVALRPTPGEPSRSRPYPWRAWLGLALVVGAGMVVFGVVAGTDYAVTHRNPANLSDYVEKVRRGMDAESLRWNLLRWCAVPGLILCLLNRRLRRFGAMGLVLAGLYVWLLSSADAVVMSISRPFYSEPPRVRYTMVFFVPVWIAMTLVWIWDHLRSLPGARLVLGRPWGILVAIAALGFLLRDAGEWPSKYLHGLSRLEAFEPEDLEFAHRMGRHLPESAFVANLHRDGSHWTWHASGRRFLRPATWPLRLPGESNRTQAVLGLAQDPWPPESLRLRDLGVTHLYVSDTYERHIYEPPADSGFERANFLADRRFRLVDRGENASVFEIEW